MAQRFKNSHQLRYNHPIYKQFFEKYCIKPEALVFSVDDILFCKIMPSGIILIGIMLYRHLYQKHRSAERRLLRYQPLA